MVPKNLQEIQTSFSVQAENFENKKMNFSKQEYLLHMVQCIGGRPEDAVLEVAAGTCVCGRTIAPHVGQVVCVDATPAMLAIGRREAEKSGVKNIEFIEGFAEELPFADESFDIVLTRFSFHHFVEMEPPFSEMHRVLKKNGKLVVIDMEAAAEPLRGIADRIDTMRDPSHVRTRSREELLALYHDKGYGMARVERTKIPVTLAAWMELTQTPPALRGEILRLMAEELDHGAATGFAPYQKDGELYYDQRLQLLIGVKPV